ncbi:MAG TPA: cysteine desulfurase family protein [Myxococcota bacterium]|nr:cysteine desulfurase family protein [Myxococcota bacterium]
MRIYLDHNATTPLREEVAEAMARALRDLYGNPSSPHAEGARARAAVERAREQVAALVAARPAEIVFTSGATEANHLAIHGAARAPGARGRALVTSAVEHPSVEEPLVALASEGFGVERVPVDGEGRLDLAALDAALDEETALCSCIWAQNETGVLAPVEAIAERCRARGVPLHVDATQALGKLPVRLDRVPADLLSASAHKLNGPKGVGFLVVRAGRELAPWLRGGGQERGRRGGTVNAPGIVGLGVAAELAAAEQPVRAEAAAALRHRLWEGVVAKVPRVRRSGAPAARLPNTLLVEFEGVAGDVLVEALDGEGIAASAGAACASGAAHASPTLLAMGRTAAEARSAVRFSVGWGNDERQIDRVLALLPDLVARARAAAGAAAR